MTTASLIFTNGKFHTVDRANPLATAVAIKDGKFLAVFDGHRRSHQRRRETCRR